MRTVTDSPLWPCSSVSDGEGNVGTANPPTFQCWRGGGLVAPRPLRGRYSCWAPRWWVPAVGRLADDRLGERFLDTVGGRGFQRFGDELGVFVGIDVYDLSPAHPHDVHTVVLIRRAVG